MVNESMGTRVRQNEEKPWDCGQVCCNFQVILSSAKLGLCVKIKQSNIHITPDFQLGLNECIVFNNGGIKVLSAGTNSMSPILAFSTVTHPSPFNISLVIDG